MNLPTTLRTNYYTTLQVRYQEDQYIMTTPWHLKAVCPLLF